MVLFIREFLNGLRLKELSCLLCSGNSHGRFAEDVVEWAWQTKHGDGVRVSVGEAADTGGESPSLDWPVVGDCACPLLLQHWQFLIHLLPSGNQPPLLLLLTMHSWEDRLLNDLLSNKSWPQHQAIWTQRPGLGTFFLHCTMLLKPNSPQS